GITLPSTVTDIGEDAFGYCYNLTNIHVAAGNTAYASIDGVLFNGAKTLLIQYPAGNTRTEYTVPDGVTEIGAAAFMFCEKLEKVSMPEGVTEIGDFAFVWCEELIAFTFPDSLTRIGYGAFEDTGWLINQPGGLLYIGRCLYTYKGKMPSNAAIVIAAGIVSISSGAFDRFDSMKSVTLPDGLLCIGEWAFYGCEKLTEIAIPDSVVEIGTMAFEECAAMTQIKVGAGNAAYSSLDGVLFDKEKTVLIKYPEGKTQTAYVVPEGVTELAEWAFWNAAFLGVTLPDSLISIQLGAFGKCGNLEDIYIPPSVTSMGESVFGWWYMYEDFVVYGELGSYAETYCWDNYVPFLPVPGDFLWGDVDRQNGLDISDARMVLQYLVGKITLTPTQLSLANVDGKNGVTITDARLMLQRLVGKIAKFPVEK
ncbi:MAG: leucine-rich repeat protein, partial [Oscillospiraceae bacterium]|nr:leucine-rich repeat protein [Oscillospiraceae bacterium]